MLTSSTGYRTPRLPAAAVLCLSVCGFLTGCDTTGASTACPPGQPGACYFYQAFGPDGAPLVEGHLTIDVAASGSGEGQPVEGVWIFDRIQPGNAGPQVGSGILRGRLDDRDVLLRLNPDASGSEVELNGTIDGNAITGVWTWLQAAEPVSQGTFTARAGL